MGIMITVKAGTDASTSSVSSRGNETHIITDQERDAFGNTGISGSHGSIALGDYIEGSSDIDFVALFKGPPSDSDVQAIIEAT